MTDEDKIRRARSFKAFYDEDGGLGDILTRMREAHHNAMAQTLPWECAKLANLKIAADVVTHFDQAVRAIIDDGKIAEHAADFIQVTSDIPDFKRRWA